MIRLKDVLDISCSDVSIMNGTSPAYPIATFSRIRIDPSYYPVQLLDPRILIKKVAKMDTFDNRIRVWLKEEDDTE